jgi:hypothetical protein
MAITHYIVLAAGVFLLSLTLGYVAWKKLHSWKLCADLLAIRIRVQNEAISLGCLNDAAYRHFSDVVDFLISQPRFISWSHFLISFLENMKYSDPPQTNHDGLKLILDRAKRDVGVRIVGYLLYETVTVASILLFFPPIVSRLAEKKVNRPVERYIDEMNIGPGSHGYAGANC